MQESLTPDGKRGTMTDINGKYSIDLAEGDAVLSFSFLSYTTQDILIGKLTASDIMIRVIRGRGTITDFGDLAL